MVDFNKFNLRHISRRLGFHPTYLRKLILEGHPSLHRHEDRIAREFGVSVATLRRSIQGRTHEK